MQNYPGYHPRGYPPSQHPQYPQHQQGYNAFPPSQPRIPVNPPPPPIMPNIQPTPQITAGIAGQVGPFGPTPSIIPGPFILLLLLPSIPLLLFSLGARPPDTSHLPFTTSDIFTTGAFITVTGTIVLCLGVYPEAGGAVWQWIREGGQIDTSYLKGLEIWKWTGGSTGETVSQKVNGNEISQSLRNARSAESVKWVMKWHFDEKYRRWIKIKVPAPVQKAGSHMRSNTKGIHTLASKHLSLLRKSFPAYYSEYKPKLVPSLLVIGFGLFLLILLVGAILGSAYDSEAKSSSSGSSGQGRSSSASSSKLPSWVERELRKRKEEKPDMTLKRMKEESKKEMDSYKKMGGGDKAKEEIKNFQKKREKEKEILRSELKKRKLPLVGLDDKDQNQSSKDKVKKVLGMPEKKDKDKDHEGRKDEEEEGEEDGKSKGKKDKVKKFLLGEKASNKLSDNDIENKTAGPGWEIADTSLAQHTMARSEMNAQQMAQKLKAGG